MDRVYIVLYIIYGTILPFGKHGIKKVKMASWLEKSLLLSAKLGLFAFSCHSLATTVLLTKAIVILIYSI